MLSVSLGWSASIAATLAQIARSGWTAASANPVRSAVSGLTVRLVLHRQA